MSLGTGACSQDLSPLELEEHSLSTLEQNFPLNAIALDQAHQVDDVQV